MVAANSQYGDDQPPVDFAMQADEIERIAARLEALG
jgi:hypothetical protein